MDPGQGSSSELAHGSATSSPCIDGDLPKAESFWKPSWPCSCPGKQNHPGICDLRVSPPPRKISTAHLNAQSFHLFCPQSALIRARILDGHSLTSLLSSPAAMASRLCRACWLICRDRPALRSQPSTPSTVQLSLGGQSGSGELDMRHYGADTSTGCTVRLRTSGQRVSKLIPQAQTRFARSS